MKKVFITGAGGFLGKDLINLLYGSYSLTLLEHKKLLTRSKRDLKIVSGSMNDVKSWERALSGIDVVIHLAGVTHSNDPNMYRRINTEGTIALVKACAKHNVRQFIYISTRAIGNGCGPYGESKRGAENFLKKSGLTFTILRVGEVYNDEFDSKEGLGNLFKFIKKSYIIPSPQDTKIKLAPILVDDVISCIVACIGNRYSYNKTYVVAGPEDLLFKQVVLRIADKYRFHRILIPIPTPLLKLLFSVSKIVVGVSSSDQLDRFLCKKESLSKNVLVDLKVKPRRFLVD